MELRYTVIDPTKKYHAPGYHSVPRDVQPRWRQSFCGGKGTPSRWALQRAWLPETRGCR